MGGLEAGEEEEEEEKRWNRRWCQSPSRVRPVFRPVRQSLVCDVRFIEVVVYLVVLFVRGEEVFLP